MINNTFISVDMIKLNDVMLQCLYCIRGEKRREMKRNCRTSKAERKKTKI